MYKKTKRGYILTSRMTKTGLITIPASLRDLLGIRNQKLITVIVPEKQE